MLVVSLGHFLLGTHSAIWVSTRKFLHSPSSLQKVSDIGHGTARKVLILNELGPLYVFFIYINLIY
jgi:hypothetical protein